MLRNCLLACSALAMVLGGAVAGAQTVSPVPPAVQAARRAMLNKEVNTLTFRSMDRLFTTRTVARAGPVWQLPRRDAAMAVSYQFGGQTRSQDDFYERTYTNALAVMKDGRLVFELYRNGSDDRTRFMSWSMAKSITSTLVGIALSEGRIKSLDDPIDRYLPELKDGAYRGVTIRQVLQMRSGVDYEERYDFENPGVAARNHENALVQNVQRFADPARTIGRAHAPGSTFAYKTIDTAVLGWLIERVAGTNVASYMASRIWEPLGAEADGFFIMDGPPGVGREFTGAGYNATLRDYARFGQMILDGGRANGRQIVPAAWLREASAPAAAEGPQGGYGYQWWTVPGSDAFYALGLQGQFIYVDPATRTVVIKLSYFPPGAEGLEAESLAFMAAVSRWQPGN
jgi:CubicO group peptidase (beta-lactamase class C family)